MPNLNYIGSSITIVRLQTNILDDCILCSILTTYFNDATRHCHETYILEEVIVISLTIKSCFFRLSHNLTLVLVTMWS